ncbi:MAG TPA: CHAT domain-containing tetratricopeptide repeat protein [Candidatus Acidoferrales bacterium]|nr:CHAT domain-containing tetratricopeptide repeat protein [Candidatus Acidoferrales bacterium]
MTTKVANPLSEGLLAEIALLKDESAVENFFARHAGFRGDDAVQQLNEASREKLRIDPHQALALAEAAELLARNDCSEDAKARSLRAKANALYNIGENSRALDFHSRALEVFRRTGNREEQARTLNASIQPNILLGRYDRALEAAEGARELFRELGDSRRLGHVEINVGNLFHRQDRFEDALACYERAYEMLTPLRDTEGLAVTLYNMAVSLITLNDFPRALASYQRAREMFVKYGMTLLVTQSDYNIAYLYYLRGEYSRAIQMLRTTHVDSEKNGDAHVHALCYLDLSEIYLELNLYSEARDIAHEGGARFQKLGMGYEEAKCLANEAMASSQLGKALGSLELFAKAREMFLSEKNLVWPSLVDLYQAVVLLEEGRVFEARRFCKRAAEFFETSVLHGKAAFCHLLLARIAFRADELPAAQAECMRALERVARVESPSLHFQARFLLGQIQQALKNAAAAYESYQTARHEFETLRSSLRGEELKIAFMKNRLEVYERLVELCLGDSARAGFAEEAFGYVELAKSRSLAELLMHPGAAFAAAGQGQSGLVRRIRDMREELNWYYRRIEKEQLSAEGPSAERIESLQKEAVARENELVRVLREVQTTESPAGVAMSSGGPSLEVVRESLPAQAKLIEYFSVREHFFAAVLSHEELKIVPLTPVARVAHLAGLLRFQLAKFALGASYVETFQDAMLRATRTHLEGLYNELVAPLRPFIRGSHLIIVPHGVLHSLPFHAMLDGDRYLIDEFTISYAPSAGVYALCQGRNSRASESGLVLGVPDERAPLIEQEVRRVAQVLPGSTLVIGAEKADAALRSGGMNFKWIHIATHGVFRQDSPMFSGIRLGASYLNLFDLYQLKLDAELVTLSGCATGLNAVSTGDELLGLTRGLLYAGAESLLLTLWDVNDESTAEFITAFYKQLAGASSRAAACRSAIQELRGQYPHPYYWAPFCLIGKAFSV